MWAAISPPDADPFALRLRDGHHTIGRGQDCDVRVVDPAVSGHHARLDVVDDGAWLADLGSRNGTIADGVEVSEPIWLTGPAEIRVGHTTIRLSDDEPGLPGRLAAPPTLHGRTVPIPAEGLAIGDEAAGHQQPRPPWYRRGHTVVLGAGSLATALLAVLALWDQVMPDGEPKTSGTASQVGLVLSSEDAGSAYLSDFVEENAGDMVDMNAAPGTASIIGVDDATDPPSPADRPTDENPGTTEPTEQTQQPGGSESPDESEPSADGDTPNTGLLDDEVAEELAEWPPRPAYLRDVAGQQALARTVLTEHPEGIVLLTSDFTSAEAGAAVPGAVGVADGPGALPADQVAERLRDALAEVKSEVRGGLSDPIGRRLVVRLSGTGLVGTPVYVTWSLTGVDVPESWKAETIARPVHFERDGQQSVNLWVPDLDIEGGYKVTIRLVTKPDTVLDEDVGDEILD